MKKSILVTGGAGFIGSHTCVELIAAGYGVVVVDNFVNSKPQSIDRIERISGHRPVLERIDLRDRDAVRGVFRNHTIDAVIHFAGLKAVGESVARPLLYYDNNVAGTLVLVESMQEAGCRRLVFSSSATVYGDAREVPIDESAQVQPTNPYGSSKAIVERILMDLGRAEPEFRIALLRYFNPVGAHPSGLIGEDPAGIPNNLMPYVSQVAAGRLPRLTIHGNDYPTRDGTGERDYIHVVDLARGHLAALDRLETLNGAVAINLGTGRGTTVLELIEAFRRASGHEIPCLVGPRRPGDVSSCYADASRAFEMLGWRAELKIDQMCADAWRWQHLNPQGMVS